MVEKIVNYLEDLNIDVISFSERTITTKFLVDANEIVIQGVLVNSFPFDPPSFYLLDRSKYGILGHVGWPSEDHDRGLICNGRSDGLSLNYENEPLVYYSRLKYALDIVSSVTTDSSFNEQECRREFLGHWNYGLTTSQSLIYVGDSDCLFKELNFKLPNKDASSNLDKKIIAFDANYGGLSKVDPVARSIVSRGIKEQGKAFKLRLANIPLPPSHREPVADWLKSVIKSQTLSIQKELKKISRRNKAQEVYLIFEAVDKIQIARFAIKCLTSGKECIPLHDNFIDKWSYDPIRLESYTKDYLLPRGGASLDYRSKKVTIVGCGSIGAIIADQIAASGVGYLTLCDTDVFSSDNLYRHSLSMSYSGYDKSASLKIELETKYPFLVCQNITERLLSIDEKILRESDLIIIAIGSTTHELAFNEKLLQSTTNTPIINTWLEPYGIGGHATFTINGDSKGCYGCSFVSSEDPSELQLLSNMNFIAENQDVSKSLGTCGSLYLPYSQVHASQTATIASKLALEHLSGKLAQSTKVSWSCGLLNKPAELSEVIHTQRFKDFTNSLNKESLISPHCPYCND